MSITSPARPVIETHGLCKRYGAQMSVDHLDLAVPAGSVYGFIGPNGAGKSTTMKMLLGLIHPTAGAGRWTRCCGYSLRQGSA